MPLLRSIAYAIIRALDTSARVGWWASYVNGDRAVPSDPDIRDCLRGRLAVGGGLPAPLVGSGPAIAACDYRASLCSLTPGGYNKYHTHYVTFFLLL